MRGWNRGALAAFLGVCVAHGAAKAAFVESFESGSLNGWTAEDMNGSTGTVSAVRSSDGTYSYENAFTVPAGWAGWGLHSVVSLGDVRTIMNSGATTLSVDAYSDWANPQGWGVYGNSVHLILNYQGGWNDLGPASGNLANGSFQTLTFDVSPHAATITNPTLSYSQLQIVWFLGTWADNGLANGTYTIALDNITITQPAVPEPASLGVSAVTIGSALRRHRRLRR